MFFFFNFPQQDDSSRYDSVSDAIQSIIRDLMDKVMNNVLYKAPFIPEEHHAKKPLYAALVPDEIFKGSHFERRFVTSFGGTWEKLAVAVGKVNYGKCDKGVAIDGTVRAERLKRIEEVLNRLEARKAVPNWDKELEYILDGGGEPMPVRIICDLLIYNNQSGETYAFELKGPLPDSDQTKVSKQKLFKLLAMDGNPIDRAYFALPYNPYGKRENYVWSFPFRWFDMKNDSSVLIGDELWDMIGGKGTYNFFIEEVNKLGAYYKELIYKEYLSIESPKGIDDYILK